MKNGTRPTHAIPSNVSVRSQRRQQALNNGRLITPVQEREPFPPLPHDRRVHGEGAGPGRDGHRPHGHVRSIHDPIIRQAPAGSGTWWRGAPATWWRVRSDLGDE